MQKKHCPDNNIDTLDCVPSISTCTLCAQKNRLIETALLI